MHKAHGNKLWKYVTSEFKFQVRFYFLRFYKVIFLFIEPQCINLIFQLGTDVTLSLAFFLMENYRNVFTEAFFLLLKGFYDKIYLHTEFFCKKKSNLSCILIQREIINEGSKLL